MKFTLFDLIDAAAGCAVLFGLLAFGLWVLWWPRFQTPSAPHCAALSLPILTGQHTAAPMALTPRPLALRAPWTWRATLDWTWTQFWAALPPLTL
jgi:hypothetical protein